MRSPSPRTTTARSLTCPTSDYNADIGTADSGGTLLRTPEGNTVTVTLHDQPQEATRTYTTDSTGLANNEDSYTSTPVSGKFTNDRVIGEIVLTKSDLDQAVEGADTALHGTASIEGAVYDLYAAEDIQHPDGVSGTVDYSKIVDANGTPIWHTTVLTNGGWDTDYLPVLAKDHLVASAEIKDSVLAFTNLYLGKYYLVERATGIVLPVDTDGHFYLTGQYPVLDRTLQPTGETQPLATEDGEYTDYVYRNQYSAVAEGRALSGVKTYDGYYLSFAEGYLCDEINHYSTLAYGSEAQYITRDTDGSKDAVLKSGFSIQKIVSTTGPGSPAPKLEGAGFTVYRIWELSKVDEFQKNADGTYNVQSILDAYRKDSYDNNTAKYDFTGEGAAVARMFESDASLVAEYNASLTAAGDYANGQGDGWVPTGAENEYILSEIFTNEEGICPRDRPAVWPVSGRGNDLAQRPVPGRPVCGHGGFSCAAERPVPAGWQRDHAQQLLHDLQCAERRTGRLLAAHQDRRRNRQAGQDRRRGLPDLSHSGGRDRGTDRDARPRFGQRHRQDLHFLH